MGGWGPKGGGKKRNDHLLIFNKKIMDCEWLVRGVGGWEGGWLVGKRKKKQILNWFIYLVYLSICYLGKQTAKKKQKKTITNHHYHPKNSRMDVTFSRFFFFENQFLKLKINKNENEITAQQKKIVCVCVK